MAGGWRCKAADAAAWLEEAEASKLQPSLGGFHGEVSQNWWYFSFYNAPIMENQMEKKMENYMETAIQMGYTRIMWVGKEWVLVEQHFAFVVYLGPT